MKKIETIIYEIRGQRVMLDCDLAELYEVDTKNLNKAVRRNLKRFPEDFMFQLNSNDLADMRFQFGTSSLPSRRNNMPYAFTENGIAMLSGILHSDRAIEVNIYIMRTFTKLRSAASTSKNEINKMFRIVFDKLEEMDEEISEIKKASPTLPLKRKRIGLK